MSMTREAHEYLKSLSLLGIGIGVVSLILLIIGMIVAGIGGSAIAILAGQILINISIFTILFSIMIFLYAISEALLSRVGVVKDEDEEIDDVEYFDTNSGGGTPSKDRLPPGG